MCTPLLCGCKRVLTYFKTKWDIDKLHRHSDFEPVKKPAAAPPPRDDKEAEVDTSMTTSATTDVAPAEFEVEFGSKFHAALLCGCC